MQDGYTQSGSGPSDMRLGGSDLQHSRQTRTADELHVPVRIVRQQSNQGGPMKEHMDHHNDLHHHIAMEQKQHENAKDHVHHHLARHHARHHDTQHGHDAHSHHYG